MGGPPCDALQVELALDRLEGELAVELPAHMRAFARAHAERRPPPAAPLVARLASSLEAARAACMHELLADRGLALLRLVAPLVIEDDPRVAAARAEPPSWPGLARLAAIRDEIALARFGRRAIDVVHGLHGVAAERGDHGAPGPSVEGWHVREATIEHGAIIELWNVLAACFDVRGHVRIDRAAPPAADAGGRAPGPRTFVIEPGREVVVVLPHGIDTPAARFAVLHELGHAIVALALPAGTPRVLDEAVASYVARLAEPPSWLPARWATELAAAARRRRTAIAAMLDDVEHALPALAGVPGATPPPALWHDPYAQAAYVQAEVLADRLRADLGAKPPCGQLVRAGGLEGGRIDCRARW
jgi:hypothetical protein